MEGKKEDRQKGKVKTKKGAKDRSRKAEESVRRAKTKTEGEILYDTIIWREEKSVEEKRLQRKNSCETMKRNMVMIKGYGGREKQGGDKMEGKKEEMQQGKVERKKDRR